MIRGSGRGGSRGVCEADEQCCCVTPSDLQAVIPEAISRDPLDRCLMAGERTDDLPRFMDDSPGCDRCDAAADFEREWQLNPTDRLTHHTSGFCGPADNPFPETVLVFEKDSVLADDLGNGLRCKKGLRYNAADMAARASNGDGDAESCDAERDGDTERDGTTESATTRVKICCRRQAIGWLRVEGDNTIGLPAAAKSDDRAASMLRLEQFREDADLASPLNVDQIPPQTDDDNVQPMRLWPDRESAVIRDMHDCFKATASAVVMPALERSR